MLKNAVKLIIIGIAFLGMLSYGLDGYAAEFEVTNDNVNIRAEASTASNSVGSTNRGRKFTIEGEATDSAGNIWYRVNVEGNTYGYIRSDLGRVSGGTVSATEATPIPARYATINTSSVRVRSGASTSHSEVASIQRGTSIVLSGEVTDSAGRIWYFMTATIDGREVQGFVRSDLISVGELVDTGEGSYDDGEEQYQDDLYNEEDNYSGSQAVNNEELNYEIRYIQNDVGGYDYFLYDRRQSTQWKVEEFLELRNVAEANQKSFEEQSKRERTIIIVLAVIIILLVLVLTVLIFKIRDLSEDLDAENGPQDNVPPGGGGNSNRRANNRAGGHRQVSGNRQESRISEMKERDTGEAPKNRKIKTSERPRPVNQELKAAESEEKKVNRPQKENVKPAPKQTAARKPQNFLTDDDEFEFEFLNIDE